MKKIFCFTVDLDRDVNLPVPEQKAAGSMDRGNGTSTRFASSEAGLRILSEIADDLSMPVTYFAEGRTLSFVKDSAGCLSGNDVGIHGLDHEDLSDGGKNPCCTEEKEYVLSEACNIVKDITGKSPTCSRMPYMVFEDDIMCMLPRLGISFDSSTYAEIPDALHPYITRSGLVEVPVPNGKDRNGKKITSYLWPMHEGRRTPEDYLHMASSVNQGVYVLATHTWHMVESRTGGIMSPEVRMENEVNVRRVLEGILDMGFTPMSLPDAAYADLVHSGLM